MAEENIDRLAIEISATSTSNSKGIEKLAQSLEKLKEATGINETRLTGISKSILQLKNSLEGSTQASQNAKQLANSINKIKELNNINLTGAANSIKQFVASSKTIGDLAGTFRATKDFSDSISKLKQSFKKLNSLDLTNVPEKIEALVSALRPLTDEMMRAGPYALKYGEALKNLSNSVKVANKANNQYKMLSSSISKTNKLFESLSNAAITGFATVIFSNINSSLSNSVDLINQYIEDMNLFAVSMGKAAEKGSEFAETMQSLLGINAGEAMRNMGLFNNLVTSFGVANEQAYILSKNLTQLGYDLSSFFNISIGDSFQKIQAGIAGEIEPLRRLGIDLSEARLQQELYNLGIQATYSNLNQADKSLLRYIAILKQTQNAQGDMGRTINQPANALRVLTAQLNLAARSLGSIFIPALQALLPPTIAAVQVIRQLIDAIASLVGFKMPDLTVSDQTDYGNIASGIDDIGASAGAAAKEINYLIGGFDELNVMNAPSSGGGGGGTELGNLLGDITLPEYDMFKDYVGNQVDAIVEKIQNAIEKIKKFFEPLTTLIRNYPQLFKGIALAIATAFAVKKVSDFFKIFKSSTKALSPTLSMLNMAVSAFKEGNTIGAKLSNTIKSLWTNFKGFMSGLSPVTQFAITIGALAGEFYTVSEATKQFQLGNIDLISALGQSVIAIGAASIALTSMFGPIGTVAALFTGLIAILKGVKDAQLELDRKMLESEMFNNGGIKISTLVSHYESLNTKIRESSTVLSDSFTEWENNRENIELLQLKIIDFNEELATSSEDIANQIIPQITESFESLTKSLIENINLETEALKSWFTLNKQYLEQTGNVLDDITAQIDDLNSQATQNIKNAAESYLEAKQALASDPNNEEWLRKEREAAAKFAEYSGIVITTSTELQQQISMKNIDFKSYDEAAAKIKEINTITTDTLEALATEEEQVTAMFMDLAQQAGASAEQIAQMKSVITGIFDIKEAEVWESREELLNILKTGYQNVIDETVAHITPTVSDKLSANGLFEMGIAGSYETGLEMVMAERIADKVDTSVSQALTQADATTRELWAQYGTDSVKALIDSMDSVDVSYTTQSIGSNVMQGIFSGINQETAEWNAKDVSNSILNKFKTSFGIHSPSTVMKDQIGIFLAQGMFDGFTQQTMQAQAQVSTLIFNVINNAIAPLFTYEKWALIFTNVVNAARDKTNEGLNNWKTTTDTWINSDVKNLFSKENWLLHYEGMKIAFEETIKSIMKDFSDFKQSLTSSFKQLISELQNYADRHPIIIEIRTVRVGSSYGDSDAGEVSSRSSRRVQNSYMRSIPALANGGVLTSPTVVLGGEYAGAKSNPEIVAPQSIMRDTVQEANTSVVAALYQLIEIAQRISEKSTTIEIDGDTVGRQIEKSNRLRGYNIGVEY